MTRDQLLVRLRTDIESGGASEAMKETLRGCLAALERPGEAETDELVNDLTEGLKLETAAEEISAKLMLWHEARMDRAHPDDQDLDTLAKQATKVIDRLLAERTAREEPE